jgi:rubrerythrin
MTTQENKPLLGNEHLPDPEFFDDDKNGDQEPDYYLCYSCGYSCLENHGIAGCPKCTAIMNPENY